MYKTANQKVDKRIKIVIYSLLPQIGQHYAIVKIL